jgi:hypothetical protein
LLIQSRLYFAIFPAWALLSGAGLDALWSLRAGGIRFGRLASALALFMFGLNTFAVGKDVILRDPLRYLLRLENSADYLQRNMGSYSAAMRVIDDLPAQSHVLFLWEARGFYCQPRCDSDEAIDRWFHDASLRDNALEMAEAWRAEGFTHMLIYNQGAEFIRAQDSRPGTNDWTLLDQTLALLPVERRIGGAYTLYRLPQNEP